MADFRLSRSIHVAAAPEQVHPHLDDFRRWQEWSPWEDLDPRMRHTYSGAATGVGSTHSWKGNSKVGEGSMTMMSSTSAAVVCDLRFLKPIRARNVSRFDLVPTAGGTDVTWTMTGRQNPLMRLLGRLLFDRAIAKDFDRGLANLKAVAERS